MRRLLALFAVLLLVPFAWANKANDTLNVAYERTMLTLDTYATSERLALILSHNWGDTLIYRDPESGDLKPGLATSWKVIDDKTFEFTLRKGVTFHDGEPFSAKDVKATFDYVTGPAASLPGADTLQWIASTEVVDPYTVRIHAKAVTPTALQSLAMVGVIYPAGYLKDKGPAAMGKAPVGTGPYKFVSWDSNTITFVRNDNYFGGSKGMPSIKNLVIHVIPEEASRIAALRTGQIDIARSGTISPDQADSVRGKAHVEAANILRIWFIQMDALGKSGTDVFTDPRVRQAVNYAINKKEIVDGLLQGYGKAIDTPCNPVQFGCDPKAAVDYGYNPEKAKQLLAEAGYPNGFTVDMYGYRDQAVFQAIQGYLQQVGIRTNLKWYGGQYDVVSKKEAAGETPLFFGSWGSSSIYDASAIMNIFFEKGKSLALVANDQLTTDLEKALETVDTTKRKALYDDAIHIVTSQAYWVPLYSGTVLAGVSNDLNWTPSSDEIERYFLASWK